MKKRMMLMSALLISVVGMTQNVITGPDGKLQVSIFVEQGIPNYSVQYEGVSFLDKSPLGLNTNIGNFTQKMELGKPISLKSIVETYSLPNIKKSQVQYKATEGVCTFVQGKDTIYDVIFRVSNNDVALKYKMYQQGETLCCIVNEEATGFALPKGSTTFLCPQSIPQGGWKRTYPSYETGYSVDDVMGKNGEGKGFTFPCLFRISNQGWVMISETGVSSLYCGSRLQNKAEGLYTVGYPMATEYNGNGTTVPGIALPGETPWRTITVGKTLAPIVETTVAFDVVKPLYEPSTVYKYGRGSWSWIIGMDESINYDEQRRYIDFTAAMGYESILVDNWWDQQIGRENIAKLAQYGASKGVALFLWYNSNGYWNDAPQTPRGIMSNTIARRREMKWMQSIGVRGIKVDFFGSDKQVTMQLYEDILSDANDYGLMVIFHGCTLPRGWERMYPNFVACEAVLASENLHFAQHNCDLEAFNTCLHPIIRNSVAAMDFGGSTLNKYYNVKNEKGGTRRVTSDVFALAAAVLFQSPVQHFAMAPNNLTDAPAWAINFMKTIPTTWDDLKFIDGYPGKYLLMARKKGNIWYVVGVNAEKTPLKVKTKLPMFKAGEEVKLYSDDLNLKGSVTNAKLNKKQEIQLTIPSNGAFVIVK